MGLLVRFFSVPSERFPIRESDRFKMVKKYSEIKIKKPFSVFLDIACGANPFPKANVLCDLHVEPVPDRSMKR